jgi:hypothetical protein
LTFLRTHTCVNGFDFQKRHFWHLDRHNWSVDRMTTKISEGIFFSPFSFSS